MTIKVYRVLPDGARRTIRPEESIEPADTISNASSSHVRLPPLHGRDSPTSAGHPVIAATEAHAVTEDDIGCLVVDKTGKTAVLVGVMSDYEDPARMAGHRDQSPMAFVRPEGGPERMLPLNTVRPAT
ncbi:hypothetical protein [Streptomyces sp. SP18CS02]|uniref:hypothetical protein n=1 Tax=Streptomyces sp. SP18CS02 TaxID=3002531 RepID=UPI002E78FE78|nr:hypothetical protein [Streptomyces sp. SP18CS02]MEE1753751.1 hypothetical protein [Streptomyces sp. SP18CS02]